MHSLCSGLTHGRNRVMFVILADNCIRAFLANCGCCRRKCASINLLSSLSLLKYYVHLNTILNKGVVLPVIIYHLQLYILLYVSNDGSLYQSQQKMYVYIFWWCCCRWYHLTRMALTLKIRVRVTKHTAIQ